MKTSFVSNLSLQNTLRLTVARAQGELQRLEKESVTGRHADVGAVLGAGTARTLTFHRDLQRMESLKATNGLAAQRLTASQEALAQISAAGGSAMEALIALSGASDRTAVRDTLGAALSAFTAAANTSFSGEYLFAGINSDVMPVADYLGGPGVSAGRQAFRDAFDAFMQTEGYASAADIEPDRMEAFIADFSAQFDADWQTTWSSASSETLQSRITASETVQSSTSANSEAMRRTALGLVLGYELLSLDLAEGTAGVVTDAAIDTIGGAVTGINAERSRLGFSQARIKQADETLEVQVSILTKSIQGMESVDTYEAATRVTMLESQLSLAYTLTSRIQNLSLLNYL